MIRNTLTIGMEHVLHRLLGDGWRYRFPRHYQRLIDKRFGRQRRLAFSYFVDRAPGRLERAKTCLDLACGTGLTSLWLARRLPQLTVIGVDVNTAMLREASRQANHLGLSGRCLFLEHDVQVIERADVTRVYPGFDGSFDIIVSALGYSVIPDPQKAFANSLRLLSGDGHYAIFDQFIPGTTFPDFRADQSRESWLLVEEHFAVSETKWFGKSYIAIGHGKKPPDESGPA